MRCAFPESSLASAKPRADFGAYLPEIRRQPDHWISMLSSLDPDEAFVDLAATMAGKTWHAGLPSGRLRVLLTHPEGCGFQEVCDPNLSMARVTRRNALQTLALSLMLRSFDRLEDMCEVVNIGGRFAPGIRLDSSHGEAGIKYGNRILISPACAYELFSEFPPEAADNVWYRHDEQPIFVLRKPAAQLTEEAVRFPIEQGTIMETLEPHMVAFGANVAMLGRLAAES